MKTRRSMGLLVVFLVIVSIIGCTKAAPPVIKDFGPAKTKAGQEFNVTANGSSAVWIAADNVTNTTVVVWDDRRIPSFKEPYGMSAPIPKELYSKPGQYRIYLLDTKSGAKSNGVVFTVE
jgi:hypothetical protein